MGGPAGLTTPFEHAFPNHPPGVSNRGQTAASSQGDDRQMLIASVVSLEADGHHVAPTAREASQGCAAGASMRGTAWCFPQTLHARSLAPSSQIALAAYCDHCFLGKRSPPKHAARNEVAL